MKKLIPSIILLISFSCDENKSEFTFNSEWKLLRNKRITTKYTQDSRVTYIDYVWDGNNATLFNQEGDTLHKITYNDYGFVLVDISYESAPSEGNFPRIKEEYTYIDNWKMKSAKSTMIHNGEVNWEYTFMWNGLTQTHTHTYTYGGEEVTVEANYNDFGKTLSSKTTTQENTATQLYNYMGDGRRELNYTLIYNGNNIDESCNEVYQYYTTWNENKFERYSSPNKCPTPDHYYYKVTGELGENYQYLRGDIYLYDNIKDEYTLSREMTYEWGEPFLTIK